MSNCWAYLSLRASLVHFYIIEKAANLFNLYVIRLLEQTRKPLIVFPDCKNAQIIFIQRIL